ncbi:MAG: hypothetical protein LBR73_01150 [Oscillospiraceae bacterium]|nr:hypothetical protein [Oscillospiraceae bacterium]
MEAYEYKCPACGAGIHFDSDAQKMVCPFCGTEIDVTGLLALKDAEDNRPPEQTEWEQNYQTLEEDEHLHGYICSSCGGELVGEVTTAATFCPFCGNPTILPTQLSGAYKPDFVIPFKLDKEAAKRAFQANFKGKPLLPKLFKTQAKLEEVTAVYVPFWLFDANADGSANWRAARVHTWSDTRYVYKRTEYYQITRQGGTAFAHIPADGSRKMDDAYMEAIEPFDYSQMVPFNAAYLSGYLANKYDVTAQENQERVNNRIRTSLQNSLASTVQGYNSLTPQGATLRLSRAKASYALLPVWVLNANWNGRHYQFAMNGQTGKFVGKLPSSAGKGIGWFCGIMGGVTLLVWAAAQLFGGV